MDRWLHHPLLLSRTLRNHRSCSTTRARIASALTSLAHTCKHAVHTHTHTLFIRLLLVNECCRLLCCCSAPLLTRCFSPRRSRSAHGSGASPKGLPRLPVRSKQARLHLPLASRPSLEDVDDPHVDGVLPLVRTCNKKSQNNKHVTVNHAKRHRMSATRYPPPPPARSL
jgi:hypothetical protein